jgi:multidrug efflux pump
MLTLFTTPVIYLAFDRIGRRVRGIPLDTPLHPLQPSAPPTGESESARP